MKLARQQLRFVKREGIRAARRCFITRRQYRRGQMAEAKFRRWVRLQVKFRRVTFYPGPSAKEAIHYSLPMGVIR